MTTMMRRRPRKLLPAPPRTFKTLEEAAKWANDLYRALSETPDDGYGGNIVMATTDPTSADGRDGDVWIKHNA